MSIGRTTDYAGNYIYENNKLQFFNHAEGTVSPKDIDDYSAGFDYTYNYKDHLGNIRLSYTDADGNGSIDPANEIVKESNYYPFGLEHKGYNNNVSPFGNSVAKRYMFGGKELDESFNGTLNTYDFGARNYDPALGRWFVIDALADAPEQIDKSPYQYAWNNPIKYNDPDGNCPSCIWGAIIGAAVDYGLQVATNLAEGKDLNDALTEVDGKSILISAGAGALSGGISSISKLQKAGKLVNAVVDVATDTGVSVASQVIKDGEVSLKKTVIEVGAGQIVGRGARNAAGKKAANSAKGKKLQTKINEQKNIAREKSSKTPKSKANVKKAQNKFDTHVGTRAAASSTTASGAASTTVEKYEEKRKKGGS